LLIAANMWVISGASLVVGVLLCVVVGYIVCSRRSANS